MYRDAGQVTLFVGALTGNVMNSEGAGRVYPVKETQLDVPMV